MTYFRVLLFVTLVGLVVGKVDEKDDQQLRKVGDRNRSLLVSGNVVK